MTSGPPGEQDAVAGSGSAGPGRRGPRLPGRLFWRVYLNGLLLLVLVALALFGVGTVLGRAPASHRPERLAAYAAARAADLRGDRARLQRELDRMREALGAEITVYEGGGELASSVRPPLDPLTRDEQARLAAGPVRVRGRHWTFAAPVEGTRDGYVLLTGTLPSPSVLRGASFLAAVLLALALASIPLARAISAPLERLRRAVRAFGAGDLGARARLQARGEVGEVAQAFDQMADRIEALLRSEKELLANVSHELRTPLARIRVALELAEEGDLERSRRFLGEIGTDLSELEQLVEDVLAAARLDLASRDASGARLPLRRERIDVADLLARASERFREAQPGRSLDLSLPDALPAVDGDPALLRRVVDNLLDNARKYSDAGAPIRVSAAAGQGTVDVEIADRGIGVEPADLPHLFTPFFRSDRSRARGTGGVGLGLALAKRVVEAHGGRIVVESSPGAGTRVRFSVPRASGR